MTLSTTTELGPAGRNWAGNLAYRATELAEPRSLDELAALVVATPRLRVLGSRHSFNDLADTDGVLVSLASIPVDLERDLEVDEAAGTVRIPAWLRYGELAPALEARGLALSNLASLPHISVAGAVATGTHGSGVAIGSLAAQVAGVELISGTGERSKSARDDDEFPGTVVALGALGVVTHLTLDVEPTYLVAQTVYEGVTWHDALAGLDELLAASDSVSLFTTWQDADRVDQVWVKTRVTDGSGTTADLGPAERAAATLARFGGVPADGPRHPIPGIDGGPCTEQLGVPGPWFARLPHFRLEFTPSAGDELQSEYLLPRADAEAALRAIRSLAPRIAPLLQICEVRTMRGDDLWLAPSSGADALAIHFTWKPDSKAVTALLPAIEAALPATARPHWGKLFTLPADELAHRYPHFDDFRALRARLDPADRFRNAYLDRVGL